MVNSDMLKNKGQSCGGSKRFLTRAALFLPAVFLASVNVHAYQTELTATGFYSSEKVTVNNKTRHDDGGGLALQVDYAFSDIDGGDAPLSERRFSDPQNHIYIVGADQPFVLNRFYDKNVQVLAGGGDVYFLPQNLYMGGEYKEYKTDSGSKLEKYVVRAGIYPLKNLRVMLKKVEYKTEFDKSRETVFSIQHLQALGSGYALKNSLEYRDEDNDDYIAVYEGGFFFNKKASLLYGLEKNDFGEGSDRLIYRLGTDYFFTEKISLKFIYEYSSTDFSSGTEVRMNSANLSVSGYF